ncbi:MAG TPA: DNA phosphorothioation-associated putative methyltransferase, partial [Pyrinomonadaceae bacterium]|nr:DNA phosphorothioation-associated putative methyltransferase [Pyrinomonadaceae bacterium]
PRQKNSHSIFEENLDLFEPLIDFITNRGRLPDASEIEIAAIRARIGSLRRAFTIIREVTDTDQWDQIREERSQDLLVYLALTRFDGRPRFSQLPSDLRLDVRAFFSTYRHACELADELLFSAGKPEIINDACNKSDVGKQTPDALYVHASALSFLPPVLRIYEACAHAYIGAVEGANIIKLCRNKAQVSYLYYPDFETNPHPALAASLVVPLRSFHVRYQDYTNSKNPFILHRKETFVAPNHSLRAKFARLTAQEVRAGLYEAPQLIGTREGWQGILNEKGVRLTGHRLLPNNTTIQ